MLTDKQREYQRNYYAKNREKRLAESVAYQAEHRDEKREYLRAYYRANKHKWKPRTRQQRDGYNAKRRLEYATNEGVRETAKRQTKEWQRANPEKRLAQRLKKFKLSPERYREIIAQQCGGCAICGASESGDRRGHRLHVDHCHATGMVRGVLCASCNLALGKFHDIPELLDRAAEYLRSYKR